MKNQEPIKRFDRHAEMGGDTLGEIMDIIKDLDSEQASVLDDMSLDNYLFGLFDGYYYDVELTTAVAEMKRCGVDALAVRLENVMKEIETYKLS